ncbi:hypothetical protein EKD04_024535 [Chloroflexales bacterium ZM16-3]|nr:hypothetical protein [Chloroflexales bacterium ZM16-3]
MTQILPPKPISHDAAAQLIAMLETRRSELPFADEELARHRALRNALEEQIICGEQALAAWRQALAQRWQAEVIGQRTYIAVQRRISNCFGHDALYLQLVAPSQPASALTASNLLADMRRLEASLALLRPRPPFAEESLLQMREAGDRLAAAIEWSEHCEAERRRVMIEQRLATNLYERVCQKTRRLVAAHMRGDLAA